MSHRSRTYAAAIRMANGLLIANSTEAPDFCYPFLRWVKCMRIDKHIAKELWWNKDRCITRNCNYKDVINMRNEWPDDEVKARSTKWNMILRAVMALFLVIFSSIIIREHFSNQLTRVWFVVKPEMVIYSLFLCLVSLYYYTFLFL